MIGSTTFTLDTANLVVTDNNRRPYPLIANPMMFSINGFNYLIDTNQMPHTIVGNNNRSPLQTDVTVQAGQPIANSTFTLNGQIYAYVEDSQHNLLTITGTKSYMIAQPELTFKLDSSLLFTLVLAAPGAGNYAGYGRADRQGHGGHDRAQCLSPAPPNRASPISSPTRTCSTPWSNPKASTSRCRNPTPSMPRSRPPTSSSSPCST